MQIIVNDGLNELMICLEVEDKYAPDVMDDLQNRAIDTYMKALIRRNVVETQQLNRELGGDDNGGE